MRPASWFSGQSFWLQIKRSRVRFPALPWGFSLWGRIPVVTMVWVVCRIRFKVETSLTRSHTSLNSWLNPRQRSPRWKGPHHDRQPAHQLIEHPSTLIADYGREKKNFTSHSDLTILTISPEDLHTFRFRKDLEPKSLKSVLIYRGYTQVLAKPSVSVITVLPTVANETRHT